MSEEVVPGVRYFKEGRGLVDDLKALDQEAWAQVYDEHFEPLVVYALCRVGQRSDARNWLPRSWRRHCAASAVTRNAGYPYAPGCFASPAMWCRTTRSGGNARAA
jgi:hypothetical protein